MRSKFDISPEQYHAGLDKLWEALGVTGVQEQDVFTLAAAEIKQLRLLNEDKFRHLQGYCKAASEDKGRIKQLEEQNKRINEACDIFEKNSADVTAVWEENRTLKARIAALESELDPPVCRLQFPDGTVPGNAREAAEGWKRWYDEEWRTVKSIATMLGWMNKPPRDSLEMSISALKKDAERLRDDY